MDIEKLRKKAKRVYKDMILINIAIIAFGAFLIVHPWGAKEIICRVLGGLIAFWGVFRIVDFIVSKSRQTNSIAGIVFGCVLLSIGVYIVFSPTFLAAMLTAALAVILFIGALLKLQYAMRFSREHSRLWSVQTAAAVIMMVVSIIAFVNPFGGAGNFIMIFIGISLIINSVWDLLTMLYIKKFLRTQEDIDTSSQYTTIPDNQSKYVNTVAEDITDNKD